MTTLLECYQLVAMLDEYYSVGLLLQGKLSYREHVVDGFDNAPAAFMGMMAGENIGKTIIKVSSVLDGISRK